MIGNWEQNDSNLRGDDELNIKNTVIIVVERLTLFVKESFYSSIAVPNMFEYWFCLSTKLRKIMEVEVLMHSCACGAPLYLH